MPAGARDQLLHGVLAGKQIVERRAPCLTRLQVDRADRRAQQVGAGELEPPTGDRVLVRADVAIAVAVVELAGLDRAQTDVSVGDRVVLARLAGEGEVDPCVGRWVLTLDHPIEHRDALQGGRDQILERPPIPREGQDAGRRVVVVRGAEGLPDGDLPPGDRLLPHVPDAVQVGVVELPEVQGHGVRSGVQAHRRERLEAVGLREVRGEAVEAARAPVLAVGIVAEVLGNERRIALVPVHRRDPHLEEPRAIRGVGEGHGRDPHRAALEVDPRPMLAGDRLPPLDAEVVVRARIGPVDDALVVDVDPTARDVVGGQQVLAAGVGDLEVVVAGG